MEKRRFSAENTLLAVDLGERSSPTAVLWHEGVMKVKFSGKEIRGVRRIMPGSV